MRQPVSPQQLKRMREQYLKERAKAIRTYFKEYNDGQPVEFKDVIKLSMASDANPMLFAVPIEKCIWFNGWRYMVGENPFINFYDLEESLDEFYHHHCPQNLLESVTLSQSNIYFPFDREPWMCEIKTQPKKHEWGLSPEHGRQQYGPVSRDKLEVEKVRLRKVMQSIQTKGYDIYKYGDHHPCCYFLVKDDDFLCIVTSGQHRSAALVKLGWKKISFIFPRGVPRLPRLITEQHLELLAGTVYDEQYLPTVKTIFNAYFDETLREKRKQALASWMAIAEAKAQQVQPTTLVEF